MSIISLFFGTCCRHEEVLNDMAESTGYRLIDDPLVVQRASSLSGLPEERLARALEARDSVFNPFTHEKERAVAWLRLAVAESIRDDDLIFDGFAGLLIPPAVTHALRVCLIGDRAYRLENAARQGMEAKAAEELIIESDKARGLWVKTLFDQEDPWAADLYDLLIPMDKTSPAGAVGLILASLAQDVLQATDASRRSVGDMHLAARVEVSLVEQGHNVGVGAREGRVTLTINKSVMMLSRLEEELRGLASAVEGVEEVEVTAGENLFEDDVYRRVDFDIPSKVLLVDDEREFIQAVSERLQMREMGSHVVYDGETALRLIDRDEPEVMILDLKMPGIDGIEVLRRVKRDSPEIEVIILTGKGTKEDEKVCLDLGAFACLRKPLNFELLTETIKQANEKVRRNQTRRG